MDIPGKGGEEIHVFNKGGAATTQHLLKVAKYFMWSETYLKFALNSKGNFSFGVIYDSVEERCYFQLD